MSDRSGDRHGDHHQSHGKRLADVIKIYILKTCYHKDTHIDQCGRGSCRRNDTGDGCDEDTCKEHNTGGQCGQTGASACFHTGGRLYEGGNGGSTGYGTCQSAYCIRQKCLLHVRHFSILIQHSRTACGSYQSTDSIKHINDTECNDQSNCSKPANLCKSLEVKLKQCSGRHISEGRYEGCSCQRSKGICSQENGLSCPVDDAGDQHPQ